MKKIKNELVMDFMITYKSFHENHMVLNTLENVNISQSVIMIFP